jgi:hypothetical protein
MGGASYAELNAVEKDTSGLLSQMDHPPPDRSGPARILVTVFSELYRNKSEALCVAPSAHGSKLGIKPKRSLCRRNNSIKNNCKLLHCKKLLNFLWLVIYQYNPLFYDRWS